MTQEEFREKNQDSIMYGMRDCLRPYFNSKRELVSAKAQKILHEYLNELKHLQEMNDFVTESIHISPLFTSFFEQKLWIQVSAFDERGSIISSSQLVRQYEILDIQKPIHELQARWNLLAENERIQDIITPAYIDSLLCRFFEPLFRFFLSEYRYDLQKLFSTEKIEELKRTPHFYVRFCELGDWGRLVYGLRTNCDLLTEKESSLWHFCFFDDKVYEGEVFEEIHISWAVFRNCTFKNCEIKNFRWTDCRFENCTFHQVQFTSGALYATFWENSIFMKCQFMLVNFLKIIGEKEDFIDHYHSSKMVGCHIGESTFEMCHLDYTKVTKCDFPNTKFETCVTSYSPLDTLVYDKKE